MFNIICNENDMNVRAGKIYWMPSGLRHATDVPDPEHTFTPCAISYKGKDVAKIRIQPCFKGNRRLPFSKVTLLTRGEGLDGLEPIYYGFYEAYAMSGAVKEIRDLLKRSPWGADNGGVTRTHTSYENWLTEIFGE